MNLQNLVDYCRGVGLPDPFSGATVPEPLNLDAVKSAIMVRCGLLTPVYGEPEVFTNLVTHWFFTKQWTFEHLINIIQSEYSPIENVFEERTEDTTYGRTNTKTGGFKDTNAGKDTVKDSGKDQRDITNGGTDTTTNTISAFNSSTYQPDNQSAVLHGHTVDDDVTYGKQTETTHGHTIERVYNSEKDTEGGKDTLSVKRHGNIGITSADQLIEQELELLRHFDIYSFIAKLFEEDNMIMIY